MFGRATQEAHGFTMMYRCLGPDVTVVPGGFLVAWHEERFPATRTIVRRLAAEEAAR